MFNILNKNAKSANFDKGIKLGNPHLKQKNIKIKKRNHCNGSLSIT